MTKEESNKSIESIKTYYPIAAVLLLLLAVLWISLNWGNNAKIKKLEKEKKEVEIIAQQLDSLLNLAVESKNEMLIMFEEAESFDEQNMKKLREYGENNYIISLDGNELIDSSWAKVNRYYKNRETDPDSWNGSRFNRPD